MNYDLLTNSCVYLTWKALEKAGFNPRCYEGDWLPYMNIGEAKEIGNSGIDAPADECLEYLDSVRLRIYGAFDI